MAQIRVAILEDHHSIIDGYLFRLEKTPKIVVVATGTHGEDLELILAAHDINVLLLDINIPTSKNNPSPFPILYAISRLLKLHPDLKILVISMLNQSALTDALVQAGIHGYILKDDQKSIQELDKIITMIHNGGIYFSEKIHITRLDREYPGLTLRQIEALSICAAYPDSTTSVLSKRLGIAPSTMRNLLSAAYLRLGVRTRAAAMAEIQKLGLIPKPHQADINFPPG